MSFSDELRIRRLTKRMTQTQLAEKAGVKQSVISAYERGNATPSIEVLAKIADALNCKMDDLCRSNRPPEVAQA